MKSTESGASISMESGIPVYLQPHTWFFYPVNVTTPLSTYMVLIPEHEHRKLTSPTEQKGADLKTTNK